MRLYELIDNINVDRSWDIFNLCYNEEKCYADLELFTKHYETLSGMNCVEGETYVQISEAIGFDDEPYANVTGKIKGDSENYGLSFTPWTKWLGMDVEVVDGYDCSLDEAYAHIVWEMTWDGFDEEAIQQSLQKLKDTVAEIDSGKAETVSWEDLKKEFGI